MIGGRRRVPAASRRTTSRLTARRCCPLHQRAPSRTSSTAAPRHFGGQALALRAMRYRDVLLALLCQPQLPEVPHRTNQGVARTKPPGGDAAGAGISTSPSPCPPSCARGAACSSARRLCRADAGQCRGDHRTSPAIPVMSAAPWPCSPCCTRGPSAVGTCTQHVHCLVSGGGISEDAATWHPARRKFLVPIKALRRQIGARQMARDLLRRKCPDLVIPEAV